MPDTAVLRVQRGIGLVGHAPCWEEGWVLALSAAASAPYAASVCGLATPRAVFVLRAAAIGGISKSVRVLYPLTAGSPPRLRVRCVSAHGGFHGNVGRPPGEVPLTTGKRHKT